MLRIDDSPPVKERAFRLADEIRQTPRARIAFRCTEADGRSRVMARVLADVPDAVLIYVPDALDQTERVLLDVAQALGEEVAKETDAALRKEPEAPTNALGILGQALNGRRLVIDGWDRLGSSAVDAEIGATLGERTDAVRDWLAELGTLFALGRGRAPRDTAYRRWQPEEPPLVLINGIDEAEEELWERFAPDVHQYELALTLLALGARPNDDAIESATDHGLRSRIVERLPNSALHLLCLLSIHERPISSQLVNFQISTIELGADIGLWRRMGSTLLVDKGWCRWWRTRLNPVQLRAVHRELADLFAPQVFPNDSEAGRKALALVEAHRHYLAAGELDKAKTYARYGAALLVDTARQQSVEGHFEDAAELYGVVVAAAEHERLPVGQKLRAYARHYLHYNRARARLDSLKETERGYREALNDWPENALFWSRLVRVLFYDSRPAEALGELERAYAQVPEHPQKQTFLIARTVWGLLHEDCRVLDAIQVWGRYDPNTEQAREVELRFAKRVAEGWKAKGLSLIPEPRLFFTGPQEVRIERVAGGWLARVAFLEVAVKGAYPIDALRTLVERLRQEAERLIRSYTADLEPGDRLFKQRLLGAIDVVGSGVDADEPDAMWVFGDLHRDNEGVLWLRTGGNYDRWFEVPAPLATGVVVGDLPYFALVKTDAGVPTGPVKKLEPGIRRSEKDIWDQWRRRLSDAG